MWKGKSLNCLARNGLPRNLLKVDTELLQTHLQPVVAIQIEEIGSNVLDSSDAPFTLFIPNEPPVAVCKAIETEADENNVVSITAEEVDGGSYDPDEGDASMQRLDGSETVLEAGDHCL